MPRLFVIFSLSLFLAAPALAETLTLAPVEITDWKAVFGRIEARDRIPARARIGGTVVELTVSEGDRVNSGQPIARIVDEKLAFQLAAIKSQQVSARAQLANAEADLARGLALQKQGVMTTQRIDALSTQVDVLKGQIATLDAQASVITQQQAEGQVLAPIDGRILTVPAARGAILLPGETVATLGGGGNFLRLAVPERHATHLQVGDAIRIEGPDGQVGGTLMRIYPLIENGRVVADVEVPGLSDRFVDARVLVRLPVGRHEALMVPADAVAHHDGLDFVAVEGDAGPLMRAVVPAYAQTIDGKAMVEILSGLEAGDRVISPAPARAAGGSHD